MATEGLANKGKPINEVGSRQKRRQMATFRDKSECALWFAETYGLLPKSLIVQEKETGLSHEVQFSPENNSQKQTTTPPERERSDHKKTSNYTTQDFLRRKRKKLRNWCIF